MVLMALFSLLGAGQGQPIRGQSTPMDIPLLDPPIAQHGGIIAAIAAGVDGRRMWIGHGPRVEAVDLTDPAEPNVSLSGPLLPDYVRDLIVEDDRLIVAAGSDLHVLGIGESSLTLLGSIDLPGSIWRIASRDGIVYAKLSGAGPSLAVIDVRDPSRIERLSQDLLAGEGVVTDLLVRGPRLYVTTARHSTALVGERGAALHVFDIHEPEHPLVLTRLEDEVWALLAAQAGATGQEIYGYGQGALVVDLSDPSQPVLWLDVVDVSRPEAPRLLRSIATGLIDWAAPTAYPRVAISGRHAYLTTTDWRHPEPDEATLWRLHVVDLEAVPRAPLLASLDLERDDRGVTIAGFAGGLLFTERLVIDIRQPTAPKVVARVPQGRLSAIDPVRGRLFAHDDRLGLWVYEPQLGWQLEPAPPTYTVALTVTPTHTPTPRPSLTPKPASSPSTSPTRDSSSRLLLPCLLRQARACAECE